MLTESKRVLLMTPELTQVFYFHRLVFIRLGMYLGKQKAGRVFKQVSFLRDSVKGARGRVNVGGRPLASFMKSTYLNKPLTRMPTYVVEI